MGSYTWMPFLKSKPIHVGYLEPSVAENQMHVRIPSRNLACGPSSVYAVVVRIVASTVMMEELAEHIRSNWVVHSLFEVKPFGDSFQVIFKTVYDWDRALKVEWSWLRDKLIVVLPWKPRMQPSEKVLDSWYHPHLGFTAVTSWKILEWWIYLEDSEYLGHSP